MTRDPVLHDFELLCRRRGDSPLVIARDRAFDVAAVDALARQVGAVAAGLEPERLVAAAIPDGVPFLATVVALRRAGHPVLLLDAWSPPLERERIARALGAAAILAAADPWPTGAANWQLQPLAGTPRVELPADTAFVKLTSGSTGAPRGVAISAVQLAADDDQLFATMGLRETDRLLSAVPLAHSYGLSSLALPALRRGVPLVLPEAGSPFAPLELAEQHGATFFPTTPAWLHGLVRLSDPPAWPASLRLTISAGAPLAPETAERFRKRTGRPVHTFYGSSECGGICYDRDGGAAERGTVGSPVDGVRVELVPVTGDERSGTGAVHVRGPAVALGYVPEIDERLSGGRFVAGDLATWSNGELALAGRVDDLINVHGKKVSPREVELAIRALPGVEDVIVLGVPEPGTGGQLVRAVVAAPNLGTAEVLAHCRERLTRHKVPRSIVVLPELPRTPRGKIDREAVARLASQAPVARG